MKQSLNTIYKTCLLALTCLFAFSSARANILETAKIALVETYQERLDTSFEDGEVYREVVEAPQTLVARIEASMIGTNIGAFNADTEVSVILGSFFFWGTLGDDPQFKAGRKSAVFVLGDYVELPSGAEKFKKVGSVRLNWSAKKLVILITCSDLELAGADAVGASDYVDMAEPGEKLSGNGDPILVNVELGDAVGETECNVHVTSKIKVRKFWVPDYEDFEEFPMNSVTLKAGTRVPAGPVIGE